MVTRDEVLGCFPSAGDDSEGSWWSDLLRVLLSVGDDSWGSWWSASSVSSSDSTENWLKIGKSNWGARFTANGGTLALTGGRSLGAHFPGNPWQDDQSSDMHRKHFPSCINCTRSCSSSFFRNRGPPPRTDVLFWFLCLGWGLWKGLPCAPGATRGSACVCRTAERAARKASERFLGCSRSSSDLSSGWSPLTNSSARECSSRPETFKFRLVKSWM